MSQKTDVLGFLRDAGTRGICIADLPLALGYSARNRIGTLRREGFDIRSELCRVHAHDGPISRYTLKEAPASRLTDSLRPRPPVISPTRGGSLIRGSDHLRPSVGGAAPDSTAVQMAML